MDPAQVIRLLSECDSITAALEIEHHTIESAFEKLSNAIIAGESPESLTQSFDDLVKFCSAHFAHEELYLRERGYTRLEAHVKAHATLLDMFLEAAGRVRQGQSSATRETADLFDRFHSHIDHFDRPAHVELLWQRADTRQHIGELCSLDRLGQVVW